MLDMVKSLYQIDEKRSIFVGDNLHTDILFAKDGNIDSLLVLTGVTTERDCQEEGIWPSYIIQGISALTSVERGHEAASGSGDQAARLASL